MVEKIKSLITETTLEQREIEWSEVQSERIRMLQLSDWTQLNDVMLPEDHKREWRLWRDKIRNISRHTISNAKIAREALSTLEESKPTFDKVDQALIESRENNSIELPLEQSIVPIKYEKVIVKEQPIILQEKLSRLEFEVLLNEFIQNKSDRFRDILSSIVIKDTAIVIYPDDTLDNAKTKVLEYLKIRQKEILDMKLSTSSNREILYEKTEQALSFLTTDVPDIEDYPLIHLYADVNQKSYDDAAKSFLDEKREYNRILFEAERFLLYNKHRILNAEDIDSVKEILVEIRDGY